MTGQQMANSAPTTTTPTAGLPWLVGEQLRAALGTVESTPVALWLVSVGGVCVFVSPGT